MDLASYLVLILCSLNQLSLALSKINLKSSPSSTSITFGSRISGSSSVNSYSLPIYNLGSVPSNLQADCTGEALFGMYADLNSGCGSYHVCHGGRRSTFTCPEGTLFSQELMTCDYWYRVSCGSDGVNYSPQPPPQPRPQPQPPQTYYPSAWSPSPPSNFPSPGAYNPQGSPPFPMLPQLPQSPYSPPAYPSPGTYPSLSPSIPSLPPTTTTTDSERERPETEEEPRTIRPPTGQNPFDPPSPSSGPTLPVPYAPTNPNLTPHYPQYPSPQYPPVQGPSYPSPPQQFPGSYSPSSPPAGQQPPYSFNDWNQDEPEWTYAWMKKLDSSSDNNRDSSSSSSSPDSPNKDNAQTSGPYTGQPFDFALVNDKFGGPASIKERSDSPNPWLFPVNNNLKA